MIEKSPPAEVEVGTLTHNLFAAGLLIEGDHQLPKNDLLGDLAVPWRAEDRATRSTRSLRDAEAIIGSCTSMPIAGNSYGNDVGRARPIAST